MDDELVGEFIEESKNALGGIESDLLALESTESLDRDCVNRIFRAIHTIKGASSFLQFDNITTVSHRAESLLCQIREGVTTPSSANVDVVLKSVDALCAMLDQEDLGASHDVAELLVQLDAAMEGANSDAAKSEGPPQATVETGSDSRDESGSRGDSESAGTAEPVPPTPQSETAARPSTPSKDAKAGKGSAGRVTDPTTRVPSSVLGHLLQITGEMVMARNQMLSSHDRQEDASLARLSRLISEVHETVLKTRKGTTETLFNRFHRVVRDLTLSLGKEARLVIEGGELELDRSIIDAFSDPLTHLVRNCVDHALEMPEERVQQGKSRGGTIWLRSTLQSGEIVLEIEDDGRGIHPDVIKEKAIGKGVLDEQRASQLTDQEAIELIFAPGFSTKEAATDLSGRGVGMDVVKTSIEQIGGAVSLESTPGKGTRLTAHLPLAKALVTSSLTRTLLVGVGDDQFAIPDSAVCEIIRPDADNYPRDFRTLEQGEVFHLRGEILPTIHLADALQQPRMLYCPQEERWVKDPYRTLGPPHPQSDQGHAARSQPPDVAVVIIRHRQHRFALVVNEVYGIREAIVQPVPALLEHCPLYTGHAVMGDGACIFILDISHIANLNRLQEGQDQPQPSRRTLVKNATAAERILIFDGAPGHYFAAPLELAAFVLPAEPSKFRRLGDAVYYPFQDRMLSVIHLDQYLSIPAADESSGSSNIILPANVHFDVAIACGSDLTVAELGPCFPTQADQDGCSIAMFERDDKLVTLLDVYRLIELHSPEGSLQQQTRPKASILCADDSTFFRQLLAQYLDCPGWTVTLVEDGQAAWELLSDSGANFDVIISDINMPRLDGFSLAERIRGDRRFDETPLVALTTQVDEQSRLRGIEAGFDHYVAKINKLALCDCIERLLSGGRRSILEASVVGDL